ncbi:ATP-dependent 6-phosphofructokinase [Demequina capsici]|uniref:ATP-dependent 6-phosphofructokinase n=1 Tax=Demequina capsici TaxID=3075620 RepID=A0AA96JBT0_9MICO|nr:MULTISPECIES: ATP-dependent 6-phosphofructokinase [unclassified Demequina]WNM25936.1 ATP-dependent 6-phosphofructokinase [Demequina sp. OYTSA14]WNM26041.1 ATP-dependent 6-phosphofructokinase [Demequina sp. PMTSA13]
MRIGILTGGGDCPGLNAAIRAVVKRGTAQHGCSIVGFQNGWQGVIDGDAKPLTRDDVSGILVEGGTMLGTARCHPHKVPGGLEAVRDTVHNEKLDGLICIGGDGTLKAAGKVSDAVGVPVIGIPKTIDNDVVGTDSAIGFDTAVTVATEAIDRLHSTAESHNRVMVVELMGRHSGWIAVTAGIAGGADIILAPEEPFDIDQIAKRIKHRHRYKNFSIVAVAEGAIPAEGTSWDGNATIDDKGNPIAGSIGHEVTKALEARTGFPARLTVLGYVQRGGIPTAADRLLGTRFGVAAIDAIVAGESHKFTAINGEEVVLKDFSVMSGKTKWVPEGLLEAAREL